MRTHRWSVAITAAARTRPIRMFTRCLCRYAVGWPPVSTSLLEVADQTSSVPIIRIRAAAPNSVQSRRGTATRVRLTASRLIGATLIRDPGTRSRSSSGRSLAVLLAGGRIDPSRANVGSLRGGVVPGIAAFAGFTVMPLMP